MEELKADFRYSYDVECPKCEKEIDLAHSDHEGSYTMPLFEYLHALYNKLEDTEIECPYCDYIFIINGVEIY